MDKYIRFLNKQSNLSLFFVILAFWSSFYFITGTASSGYHFIDDHTIIVSYNSMQVEGKSFTDTCMHWIRIDYVKRFRPIYWIHRVFQTRVFGLDFFAWSLYLGALAVISTFLMYIFGQLVEFSKEEALLLAFLSFVGLHGAIWWRLGYNEVPGAFFIPVALIFMALSVRSEKGGGLYKVLFVVFAILMSLSKECYIVFLPSIAFFYIWLFIEKRNVTLYESIKHNILHTSILIAVSLAEMSYIVFFVGTKKMVYAGVEGFHPVEYIKNIESLFKYGNIGVMLAGIAIILGVKISKKELSIRCVQNNAHHVILFLLMAIPEAILYTKSGFIDRYLMPGILPLSFFTVYTYRHININMRRFKPVMLFMIILVCANNTRLMANRAFIFTDIGTGTKAMFRSIERNIEETSPMLVVMNPQVHHECSRSIKLYLATVSRRNNLYLKQVNNRGDTVFSKNIKNLEGSMEDWYNHQTLDTMQDKTKFSCIVVFPGLSKYFYRISKNWFVPENYTFESFKVGDTGNYIVYFAKHLE